MREAEAKILELIDRQNNIFWELNRLYQKTFSQSSFGSLSGNFITSTKLEEFKNLKKPKNDLYNFISLWLCIEDYLYHKEAKDNLIQKKFVLVEQALQVSLSNYTPEAKACGTAMLPSQLVEHSFIRNLFLLNDEKLSALFLKHLSIPPKKIFAGYDIPEILKHHYQSIEKINKRIIKNTDFKTLEHTAQILQRLIRQKLRKKENKNRVAWRYKTNEEDAKKLLEKANRPYIPQCSSELARRIMKLVQNVELFSVVKHKTAETALKSIFDDGLFGRRSLIRSYMLFKPATLWQFDINEGDSDVICMGAIKIDSGIRQNIELSFDANKISAGNPCVFYKQKDLGFNPRKDVNQHPNGTTLSAV